ncbi:hypothetical protein GCM10025864_24370 [Luteimicrobium album]|uniref:Uncharacterized protein n=1 Tax=Luteimicrobium album TaxID=1054550 RepID=A0ABQ6I3D3_9MICO|nr:hypothetical protein [Luteimicrobium album]GMA24678.1 hypothetical protein GCM10025864_24370 [Luteimicrobium album]
MQSFSGTHAYDPAHVVDRFELAAGEPLLGGELEAVRRYVDGMFTFEIETGSCPRCEGPLDVETAAGSRVTTCRCVPICTECGLDEALGEIGEWSSTSSCGRWTETRCSRG